MLSQLSSYREWIKSELLHRLARSDSEAGIRVDYEHDAGWLRVGFKATCDHCPVVARSCGLRRGAVSIDEEGGAWKLKIKMDLQFGVELLISKAGPSA